MILIFAALHGLALAGRAPELAAAYAAMDGGAAAGAASDTLLRTTAEVAAIVGRRTTRPDEAGRCAVCIRPSPRPHTVGCSAGSISTSTTSVSTAAVLSQRSSIETSGWDPGAVEDSREQGLHRSIAEADSPAWNVRAAAGRRLAAAPRIESVAGVLHRLLLDAQDTGVTSATAAALLARRDLVGLRAVLAARAVASDEGTADQLTAELDCDSRFATGEGRVELITQLRTLTSDTDPEVRNEALLRLSHLR
ncbi:DUF2332 family protein [Streptomyces sp. NPDC006339]|uniref:DUF2332 family protein n=1 Tax=Streptomyces sp. NPDC006339 TaxID=3156755 RepID=UPI0033BAC8D8